MQVVSDLERVCERASDILWLPFQLMEKIVRVDTFYVVFQVYPALLFRANYTCDVSFSWRVGTISYPV